MAAVGEDIWALCGRCGETWHAVMAMMGERVVKVVCKRCGTHHGLRGPQTEEAKAAGAPERKAGFRRAPARRRHTPAAAAVVPPFDPSKPPRPYTPREGFGLGERVIHTSFGIGVVMGSPGPGKVEIAFPAGSRVLACVKGESTLARPVAASNVPIGDRPPDK